jgi:aerobic carbon-monoxide dehydrogenase medium subunit
MKPAQFEMHTADSLEEALGLLDEFGDEAKVLAGGQSLVPMLALRLTRFDHLVDLNGVAALAGVTRSGAWLRIGAMTRHRTVERSPEIISAVPLLARATARVGHFQIRNRGTLGGAVAHADPAAEQPAVCLALDAVMEVASSRGVREVPAPSFFEGMWATSVGPDEVLTGIRFPVWAGRSGFAVEEVARRSGDFALAGVACGIGLGDGDVVDRAAIAVFGVGATPVRAHLAEEALLAGSSLEEVATAAMGEVDPPDDLHATGDYRQKVTGVLVARAITRARTEAGNG